MCLSGCGNDLGSDGDIAITVDAGAIPPTAHGGLPCDIEAFLADHCQGCHGTTPSGGAPMPLVTYADLTAKNASGVLIAQRALVRIKSPGAQMPPPPAPPATPAEIAAFSAWASAGAPAADCTVHPPPGPFDGPPVCTSGTMWTGGNSESPLMHPGGACNACHATSGDDIAPRGAPRFSIAGTVYPTGHEPNDCNGATSATVEITDAAGSVTRLPVNAAGNFFTVAAIASPFHVAVVAGGKRRAMGAAPPTGDCNSCHTQNGASGAPGRIALP